MIAAAPPSIRRWASLWATSGLPCVSALIASSFALLRALIPPAPFSVSMASLTAWSIWIPLEASAPVNGWIDANFTVAPCPAAAGCGVAASWAVLCALAAAGTAVGGALVGWGWLVAAGCVPLEQALTTSVDAAIAGRSLVSIGLSFVDGGHSRAGQRALAGPRHRTARRCGGPAPAAGRPARRAAAGESRRPQRTAPLGRAHHRASRSDTPARAGRRRRCPAAAQRQCRTQALAGRRASRAAQPPVTCRQRIGAG